MQLKTSLLTLHFLTIALSSPLLGQTHDKITSQNPLLDQTDNELTSQSSLLNTSSPSPYEDNVYYLDWIEFADTPADEALQKRLQTAFRDAMRIANPAVTAIGKNALTRKYFGDVDPTIPAAIMLSMLGDKPDSASSRFKNLVWAKLDDKKRCGVNTPESSDTLMYTTNTNKDGTKGKVVVCTPTYAIPDLDSIKCEDTCPKKDPKNPSAPCELSWRMSSLGSLALHEFIHWTTYTRPSLGIPGWAKDDYVSDINLSTQNGRYNEGAYGFFWTQLLGRANPPHPLAPWENADNYHLFASELYWRTKCAKVDYKDPKEPEPDPRV